MLTDRPLRNKTATSKKK